MATDARKHTVPADTDDPDVVGDLAALSASVRDIIQVDNTTARAAVIDALTTAGIGPTATNPVYVHRSDAAPGRELEVTTDGTTWRTLSTNGALAVASGEVVISPSGANIPTSTAVTFPAGRFTVAPAVQVTANTTVPGTSVTGVGYSGVTATGFTVWCTRTNTSPTNLGWLAMEIA